MAATKTTSVSSGWRMIRPMWWESSSPMFRQLRPPSVDLYTPSPHEEDCREARSPVPTQTTAVSRWCTTTSPTEWTASSWKTGVKVTPPFSVFHTPPVEEAR